MDDSAIQKIRNIRNLEADKLKASPFLKTEFEDEYGEVHSVKLRRYQIQGTMNMLQVPRMILGDDTGLGKTLEVLSTIGYIWLKEPEYIPIIITKKSALYQWESETKKFMQGMEAVTVDGSPFNRDKIYQNFFDNYDPDRKRLIIMTYDMLLKDIDETIIRDKSAKAPRGSKKKLKEIRGLLRDQESMAKTHFGNLSNHMKERPPDIQLYVDEVIKLVKSGTDYSSVEKPGIWNNDDQKLLDQAIVSRENVLKLKKAVEELKDTIEPPIVMRGLVNYVATLLHNNPEAKILFVLDEVHVLKNYRGKIHEAAIRIANMSERVIGMTATAVKNRLMEFFSLFRVVQPSLFPKVSHFQNEYCKVKMQKIGGGRQVPVVVGHSNSQLEAFNRAIEPYYLSRRKHQVAKELPQLVTREVICELTPDQEVLYTMAETGLLSTADDADSSHAEMLQAMMLAQQACNSPQLVLDEDGQPMQGDSSKLEAISDMVDDELIGVKTIIFSRFEKMISLIGEELKKKNVNYVRVTGKENKASQREEAKQKFQNKDSGTDIILITLAGAESINLQAAEHIIFVDSPWSWGDYVQLTGRAIRIGSKHSMVVATHLISKRETGKDTIDKYVIKTLRKKKLLADKVAGESLQDGLEFNEKDAVSDIIEQIRMANSESDRAAVKQKIKLLPKKTSKKTSTEKPSKKIINAPKPRILDIDFSDL